MAIRRATEKLELGESECGKCGKGEKVLKEMESRVMFVVYGFMLSVLV